MLSLLQLDDKFRMICIGREAGNGDTEVTMRVSGILAVLHPTANPPS